ncbi:MAG TPA: PPC domain-containing DNA-binding protein [Candidatus Obscuribacterales bacterium]
MQVHRSETGTWIVHLQKGETVCAALEAFAAEQNIGGARIQGIAGIADPELGCFDLASREFTRQRLSGYFEMVSALGNLSLLPDGKPYAHIHTTLAGPDFRALAGHLFEAQIAVLGEFFILPEPIPLQREFVPELNVAAWNLEQCGRRADSR